MRRAALLALAALASACSASGGSTDATLAPDLGAQTQATVTVFDRVRINSTGDTNLRKADAPLTLVAGRYGKATLTVKLETSCYPFESWAQNPPPAGQNWPADCDAYDRNFELRLDPPADASAPPSIELLRAITPFGGPLTLDVDVTDVVNALPGDHTLRVVIPSYSDPQGKISGSAGGWWVSVTLQTEPGTPPRDVLAVLPLFDHSYEAGDARQQVDFELPAGATKTRIEYRVTGHGGVDAAGDKACIGGAEEFCQRQHRVYLDDIAIADPAPWRTDCATLCTIAKTPSGQDYCQENPCGAIASVKASRANWCPGSVTPPLIFEPTSLAPGQHSFAYEIEKVLAGGSWRVSAVLFAYR